MGCLSVQPLILHTNRALVIPRKKALEGLLIRIRCNLICVQEGESYFSLGLGC